MRPCPWVLHGRLNGRWKAWERALAERASSMTRNLVRGILNLVLAAAATWLADRIVDRIFGPEEAS